MEVLRSLISRGTNGPTDPIGVSETRAAVAEFDPCSPLTARTSCALCPAGQ